MNATTGNVNRYTRAPRGGFGKLIRCPQCEWDTRVYHFRFTALQCAGCKGAIPKNDFLIVENNGIHRWAWGRPGGNWSRIAPLHRIGKRRSASGEVYATADRRCEEAPRELGEGARQTPSRSAAGEEAGEEREMSKHAASTSAKPEKPSALDRKVRTTLYLREELYARAADCAHYFKQKKQQPKSISQLLDDALERELARLGKRAGEDWSAQ